MNYLYITFNVYIKFYKTIGVTFPFFFFPL